VIYSSWLLLHGRHPHVGVKDVSIMFCILARGFPYVAIQNLNADNP